MTDSIVLQDELRKRMAAKGLSEITLAERAGLNRDAVRNIFRGKANDPGVLKIRAIARELGCTIEELLGENAPLQPEDYAPVPVYEARAAAGAGGEGRDLVKHHVLFRLQWLRRVTQASLDKLALIEMDGDSMEPTLRSGDHGLVDTSQNRPSSKDGIYAIRTDDGLQVKRVAAHPVTGLLRISSDNTAYPTYEGIRPNDVRVIGRIIWIGRRI